ncbi:ESX secretion-associated protein EspG [Mycobacterium sp. 050134]|uniref:ESX secretion-associated protein EspG n=1 Tax=Mycobacterium sp. 050134 TaxID=3096111 RepID=UPI002EDA7D82
MSGVLTGRVGSLDLLDLNAIGEFYGNDFLPYPFMFTQGPRFASGDEARAYVGAVPDRFLHGDLKTFMECVAAYDAADIRVECRAQYIPADTPSVRLIAYRAGHLGFFASQRPDADVIDVHTLSPYDLGPAIAEALPLTQPGTHPEIVIPEYVPNARPEYDSNSLVVRHRSTATAGVSVPASEVTIYATVQSHWRPTRRWGLDRGKRALVWVRVGDDGEYLYASDQSHARPMTRSALREEIDRLIADDIAILREFRRD